MAEHDVEPLQASAGESAPAVWTDSADEGFPPGEEWDPDGLAVFAYAIRRKAPMYVTLVEGLVAARERFRLQLRPVELARECGDEWTASEVDAALEQLYHWGNVTRFFDATAAETIEEFYGKRYLYQLTPEGIAAHAGVRSVRAAGLDAGGRLSHVLLPAIAERLKGIAAEAAEAERDPAKLYRLLIDLFGSCAELADNAGRYVHDLARETSEVSADDATFRAYKQAVLAYLNQFVSVLTELVPGIRATIGALTAEAGTLIALAATADAAPKADGTVDAGPVEQFRVRWEGAVAWFCGTVDQPAVVDHLRSAMLAALNRILHAVTRLNERHLRRVSREADFTVLAEWFAVGPSDPATLWDAAFGLYPSRHFTTVTEDVERRTSFWAAPPVELPARMRTAAKGGSTGRPGRVADYSRQKADRVAAMRAAAAQALAAAARLASRTPARLSDLAVLDQNEFREFLGLVDAALSAPPRRDGTRSAGTGTVRVVLHPSEAGGRAVIKTPGGTLEGPDYLLEIEVAGAAGRRRTGTGQ